MTEKQLELIAQSLRATMPIGGKATLDQWRRDVIAMGDACLQLDPTFNSERFYQLTGMEITLSVQT